MELAGWDEIYLHPIHPYTQALMSSVSVPDLDIAQKRKWIILAGDIPSPANPPLGCNFNTRSPYVKDICLQEEPKYREVREGHWVACHFC